MEKGELWGPEGEPWCNFGTGLKCTNGFMCRNLNHKGVCIGIMLDGLRKDLANPNLTELALLGKLDYITQKARTASGPDQE